MTPTTMSSTMGLDLFRQAHQPPGQEPETDRQHQQQEFHSHVQLG